MRIAVMGRACFRTRVFAFQANSVPAYSGWELACRLNFPVSAESMFVDDCGSRLEWVRIEGSLRSLWYFVMFGLRIWPCYPPTYFTELQEEAYLYQSPPAFRGGEFCKLTRWCVLLTSRSETNTHGLMMNVAQRKARPHAAKVPTCKDHSSMFIGSPSLCQGIQTVEGFRRSAGVPAMETSCKKILRDHDQCTLCVDDMHTVIDEAKYFHRLRMLGFGGHLCGRSGGC